MLYWDMMKKRLTLVLESATYGEESEALSNLIDEITASVHANARRMQPRVPGMYYPAEEPMCENPECDMKPLKFTDAVNITFRSIKSVPSGLIAQCPLCKRRYLVTFRFRDIKEVFE